MASIVENDKPNQNEEDAIINIQREFMEMKARNAIIGGMYMFSTYSKGTNILYIYKVNQCAIFIPTCFTILVDCSDLWSTVNHTAICVANIGRSINFYNNVIGMKQILRPDFDRYKT